MKFDNWWERAKLYAPLIVAFVVAIVNAGNDAYWE